MMLAQRFLGGSSQKRTNPVKGIVDMEIRRRTCCPDSHHPFCLWLEWGQPAAAAAPTSFHSVVLCVCRCSGISLVLKASLCIWMLLLPVVFAKVVARWVALFQCLSYRQLDIACQRRQQLQLWQGSNNPGKVNTQSTKHLFTAITEIFLHSTWH